MKTIKYIKQIIALAIVSIIIGCNVIAIPLVVNKDFSFGVILVNGLKDQVAYRGEIELDLSKFISDSEINGVESVVLKSFKITANGDYENSITKSKVFDGGFGFHVLKEGVPFNSEHIDEHQLVGIFLAQWTPNTEISPIVDESNQFNIKDFIKNKKIRIGIQILMRPEDKPFNDDSFSFGVKVETEVQVSL